VIVKAPNNEPNSDGIYEESANNALISEPEPVEEEESVSRIHYEVDVARPLERPRRGVRAPKYLGEYVLLMTADEQSSY